MKFLLLAFVSIFAVVSAFAAPAEVTLAVDVALPLGNVSLVRFYERTGAQAPFTYTLAKEVQAASTVTTGSLVVSAVVQVPTDGVLRTYVARTVTASTPLPTAAFVAGAESADSNVATITIAPSGGTGPKANRVTVIKLN